jgi:hypothetical protein
MTLRMPYCFISVIRDTIIGVFIREEGMISSIDHVVQALTHHELT